MQGGQSEGDFGHNVRMKIAAVQMVSAPDWPTNREAAARLIAEAAAAGAGLVQLPEYFCTMGQRDTDKLALAEVAGAGPIQRFLADTAREHAIWLVGGTLPVKTGAGSEGQGQVLNRCCVYGPDGAEAAHYDKVHLFAFDNGRESYDEGRTLCAGSKPVTLQAGPLRVGLSICYDLRFPELYRALMTPPCDLLCVPAAFTHTTPQARRTGNCCCALARLKTSATCWLQRKAAPTPTAAAPGATPWSLIPGARWWTNAPKAKASSSPKSTPRAWRRFAPNCRHWPTGGCSRYTRQAAAAAAAPCADPGRHHACGGGGAIGAPPHTSSNSTRIPGGGGGRTESRSGYLP